MAAPKRKLIVPVLPAVGLAAVAAGPILQSLGSSGGAGPMSASLASSHHAAGPGHANAGDDKGDHRPPRKPFHKGGKPPAWKPPADWPHGSTTTADPLGATTTTVDPPSSTTTAAPAKPTTTTTAAPTTTTAKPTTTTTAAPTTTTAAPKSPLVVSESYTQLVNGLPMLLALTVDNTAAAAQTISVTVDVTGSSVGGFLNVNADSTQTLLANWSCSPNEIQRPSGGGPYEFKCTATIPANTSNTVMVTTGSNMAAASKGTSVTVATTVTADTPAGSPLPAVVSLSQNVS